MSETVTTTTTAPAVAAPSTWSTIWSAVENKAAKALDFLKEVDAEWATIKANPAYGTLVSLATTMVVNELTALGVPVGPLVNVGASVTAALEAMAAAHPAINTPS